MADRPEKEIEHEIVWREPEEGFEFKPDTIIVTAEHQQEKLSACGLDDAPFNGFVDASFYIGIGIHAGINSGISAEGNVNMLQSLTQHRPVLLGEALTVKGHIRKITEVPRGVTVDTEVVFYGEDGKPAISAPRRSLKPDPAKIGSKGAGERPAPVIVDVSTLDSNGQYQLRPENVKQYSSEGNSIHYEMDAANRAGFRAPIIGGGMGVHYLLHSLWEKFNPTSFELSIYFRRPIFWDDVIEVRADPTENTWRAICLSRDDKVLTEAKIDKLEFLS
ncbi:MAG: hypothetical protein VB957_01310 [Pseudomonadales bacterium]|jgi:hypothetical protein